MKVSIITVVYNNKETLAEAIESVLNQSYMDIEYIVIDGNSTDGTINVVNSYLSKISVFLSEKDKGIYDAMNKGINLARGQIIGILNSDDIYDNDDIIKMVVDKFKTNDNLDVLYGDLVYVKRDNTNNIVRKWISKDYSPSFFSNGNVPPHPSLFVKKHIYEKAGLFNITFKLAADYEFMLRIFEKLKVNSLYLPGVIVKMRLGGSTNKSLTNIWKQNQEVAKAWRLNGLRPSPLLFMYRFVKRIRQFI